MGPLRRGLSGTFLRAPGRAVSGVVLLNPWVRTEHGLARAHLRHYYLQRLFQAGLWQKVARGEFKVREAAAAARQDSHGRPGRGAARGTGEEAPASERPLPDRMEDALRRFRGRVLLILSGDDLTAQEFKDVVARSRRWRQLLSGDRVTRCDLRGPTIRLRGAIGGTRWSAGPRPG